MSSNSDSNSESESGERFSSYFWWRIAPKLLELPGFGGLPEPVDNPRLSYLEEWGTAATKILSWNGMEEVSPEFKEFYDGLLYFQNAYDSESFPKQLFDAIFEVYGSDPRGLPEIIDESLRDWELLRRAFRGHSDVDLWNMIGHRGTSANFDAEKLQNKLRRGLSDVKRQVEGTSFNWVKAYYDKLGVDHELDDSSQDLDEYKPMLLGLRISASVAFDRRRECFREKYNIAQDRSTVSHSAASTENRIDLFVGPSGCGKTHKLRELLKSRWGFYLVAGNLSPRSQSDGQQPHEDQALFDQMSYRPRRSGGSCDTHTWYNDLKMIAGIIQPKLRCSCEHFAKCRLVILFHVRFLVLEEFLQSCPERRTPAAWLNFQTTLEEPDRDIFNNLFRMARFVSISFLLRMPQTLSRTEHTSGRKWDNTSPYGFSLTSSFTSKLFICIDEAQCDLVESFPELDQDMDNDTGTKPFCPFRSMVEGAVEAVFQVFDTDSIQLAISGTALRLEHIIESLMEVIPELSDAARRREEWKIPDPVIFNNRKSLLRYKELVEELASHQPELSVKSEFELVGEDSQFEAVLMNRISGCRKELRDMIIERSGLITTHSRPLRGRYQWSVSYVEKIKEQAETNSQVFGKEEAAICCQQVYNMAKVGLKKRLKEIDERFWQELSNATRTRSYEDRPKFSDPDKLREYHDRLTEPVNELCWLAIRSDLLGQSSIFQSKERADLVEQGFAFLERKRHDDTNAAEQRGRGGTTMAEKVVLKERIAVEAAVEYFQAERANGRPSRYDEALKRSFYQEQGNVSALGKKAELFFAWHLRKVLRAPEQHVDTILPTFPESQRIKVLELLVGQSENIDKLLQGRAADARFETRFGCDTDKMYLIEGSQTAFEEKSDSSRSETMWGWLETIRTGSSKGSPKSTFWFPSTMAGPDVLFALRRTSIHQFSSIQSMRSETSGSRKRPRESEGEPGTVDDSIVLCAIQIKRQRENHDIPGAIRSTSPNHWFSKGSDRDARSILHELKEWRTKGFPIVRILVTSLTKSPWNDPTKKKPEQYLEDESSESSTREMFKSKIQKTKRKSRKHSPKDDLEDLELSEIPLHQQYFNWVGVEHARDLFGDAFRDFNRAEGNE